jgi:hypothetical protein
VFDRFNRLDKTIRVRWGVLFQPLCVLFDHRRYWVEGHSIESSGWLCQRCGKWKEPDTIAHRGLEIGPSTWPIHEDEAPDTGSGEPERESPNGGSFSLSDDEPWHPSRGPQ